MLQHTRIKTKFISILSFSSLLHNITDEFCQQYPHKLIPTPGYWIECSRQKINMPNQMGMWDDSDSEHEDNARGGGNSSDAHLERGCSDLYEDDEDSEATPM